MKTNRQKPRPETINEHLLNQEIVWGHPPHIWQAKLDFLKMFHRQNLGTHQSNAPMIKSHLSERQDYSTNQIVIMLYFVDTVISP
jgi:hypothetical protein